MKALAARDIHPTGCDPGMSLHISSFGIPHQSEGEEIRNPIESEQDASGDSLWKAIGVPRRIIGG